MHSLKNHLILNINMIIHGHYICLRLPEWQQLYNVIQYNMLWYAICIYIYSIIQYYTVYVQLYAHVYTSFNVLAWSIKQCYPNICFNSTCLLDKGVSLKEALPTSRQPLKSNALNFPLKRWKHRTLRTHIKNRTYEHDWTCLIIYVCKL